MAGVITPCSKTAKRQGETSCIIYKTSATESFFTTTRNRSYGFSQPVFVVTRSVQFSVAAFLNRNNNGNSKEDDSNVENAAAIVGSKSYQGLSKVLASTRQKPRYNYLNRRHPEVHRTRDEVQTRCLLQLDNTCVGIENIAKDTEVYLPRSKKALDYGQLPLLEDIDEAEAGSQDAHATSEACVQTEHRCGPPCFSDLFQEVSLVKSVSEVPESVKEDLLLLLCNPLLDGGYQSGGCAWSSLLCDPAGYNHTRPCLAGCQSFHSAVTEVTDITWFSEEETPVQGCVNSKSEDRFCVRNKGDTRQGSSPEGFQENVLSYHDFTSDLCFTDNSPSERTESPRSFLHDDFNHEDDVLDIPTLNILSPPRASLGQAFHSDHGITSISTLVHDEDKPGSHEPFPSEYVFRRVYGPSFCVSSDFRRIKIPALPPDMVEYKLEPDGLTSIVIGSGSFGKVYEATLMVAPGQSRDVVVKEHFSNRTTLKSIANEAKIAMYLESTGCVPICYGVLSDEEDSYKIVMEFVGTGITLYDVLCDTGVPRLHWLNIVFQITSGLNKIHKKDVLINDIKSDNILVDMSGTLPLVKFCDMGSASYKSGIKYRGDMKNCVHLAPEARAYAETTPACDVYSLGRVLKKIHGVSHIPTLLTVSDMCMAEDPALRPMLWTVSQLLQEEYTQEVLFPTLTLPSDGYLDSGDEESKEESELKVNTSVHNDSPTVPGSSNEVSGDVSSESRNSKKIIQSVQVSLSNMKSTSKENDKLLGVPAVLPTEIQRKTAIDSTRSPRLKSKTKAIGSKDTSISTRGHTQNKHDATVSTHSPSCLNQVLETRSQDLNVSSSITEVGEKASDVATRTCVTEQSHECQFVAPDCSSSADVAQTTFDVPTMYHAGQDHGCHFATPERSSSSEVAEKISVVATKKSDAGQYYECQFASPECSSSAEIAENTSDVAARICVTGHSHECLFATPECSSSAEVVKKISDVTHEGQFATPECSSSVEFIEDTSDVAASKSDDGLSHECHFATPECSSSTEISEETSDVAARKADPGQSHEFQSPVASSTDVAHRSQSPSEAPHVADMRSLCQAELDEYMQWEDTTVYEDYLPLILPLFMLLFGIVGVV